MTVEPFAWRDRPSLIERILPAQKISAEAQKERKAGAGQTLTALGSYWKGRKPLILVKACVLGALLPATDDPEADLAVFELLMAIDDAAFVRRGFVRSPREVYRVLRQHRQIGDVESKRLFEVSVRVCGVNTKGRPKVTFHREPFDPELMPAIDEDADRTLVWHPDLDPDERFRWQVEFVRCHDYLTRVDHAQRPEQLDHVTLFEPVWNTVNDHLGTAAHSMPELVEQLGMLRFGHRPKVADTFCGGGSIPFEAARLGCDVYASDLNPIACMLTWGALNVIGADAATCAEIERAQREVSRAVEREITELGIEHDSNGNRAKAYFYCLEIRCPHTGWMVPLAPSWVISAKQSTIARLVPDHAEKRFKIEIVSGVSQKEFDAARRGTVDEGDVVYTLDGVIHRTPIKTIRGDFRRPGGTSENKLRRWEKHDFKSHCDDVYRERLYCVHWITQETLYKRQQETFFASVTEADLEHERKVDAIVAANLASWQSEGFIPDTPIEPGAKTDEPIRTRGWTHWHHLFSPRQLLLLAYFSRFSANYSVKVKAALQICLCYIANRQSKLCRIDVFNGPGREPKLSDTFTNQALNTNFNWGARASNYMLGLVEDWKNVHLGTNDRIVKVCSASQIDFMADIWITDPPYADAIRYEEITEYFIAWLKHKPAEPYATWIWDSRRPLAIKGSGDTFRRDMAIGYAAMANHMPDNGLQIVMFTHQDASVWSDLAAIIWGAGLRVTAAWYIATETTSELKKGGYVQGTVLLVLRKRVDDESIYRDELVGEVRQEVARQIETMVGLNQTTKGHGRSENLFEDADLQMAGYAAALRVLTGYRRIDGQDMAVLALRPRQKGEQDLVKEIIDFAVQVANEHLVPDGIEGDVPVVVENGR